MGSSLINQEQTLVLGAPGTGKTYRLVERTKQALKSGTSPDRIAFCAFTRAASGEASTRASIELEISTDDLPYFRTLHSLAFKELGLDRSDVVGDQHLAEFGDVVGEKLTGDLLEDSDMRRSGDLLLTIDNYARTTRTPIEAAWRAVDQEVDWYRLKRFVDAYKKFKADRGLLDFTDMLEKYAIEGQPIPIDLAIVDEAQDLSALQWAVVARAFAKAKELMVAGDDDQSIYRWSGAAEDYFLSLPYRREVLPISHRLPQAIFEQSQEIIHRVGRRFPKEVRAGKPGGTVDWVARPDELDYTRGSWLVLARTRYQLRPLVQMMRELGVVYMINGRSSVDTAHVRAIQAHENLRKGWRIEGAEAIFALRAAGKKTEHLDETDTYTAEEMKYDATPIWHDALIRIPLDDREYMLACRRRGEHIHETPRVRLDTVHGAKGAEAENVLLLTDITYRVKRGYDRDPDGEHRVFYVGATRASNALYFGAPASAYSYAI